MGAPQLCRSIYVSPVCRVLVRPTLATTPHLPSLVTHLVSCLLTCVCLKGAIELKLHDQALLSRRRCVPTHELVKGCLSNTDLEQILGCISLSHQQRWRLHAIQVQSAQVGGRRSCGCQDLASIATHHSTGHALHSGLCIRGGGLELDHHRTGRRRGRTLHLPHGAAISEWPTISKMGNCGALQRPKMAEAEKAEHAQQDLPDFGPSQADAQQRATCECE